MTERNEIAALRGAMEQADITWYLVPTSDFHGSEYVDGFFKVRRWLTGFTGSAGTALVGPGGAWLWTDGRYFVQAEAQLAGSGVTLMKMREPGVPTIEEFLAEHLKEGDVLGFDGRVVSCREAEKLKAVTDEAGAVMAVAQDLAEEVWKDRPALSRGAARLMPEELAGESRAHKLARLREEMKKAGVQVHLIPTLDDIAWLFNVRGSDVHCNPVVLSYAAVEEEHAYLFVQDGVFGAAEQAALEADGVQLRPYDSFYEYISALPETAGVWYDPARANAAMVMRLKAGMNVAAQPGPVTAWKAAKNEVEMDGIRRAHEKDGVAMTKFLCWFDRNVGKIPMTEISVSDHLESLRRAQEGCLDLSFDTISAYGPNAAMPHYSATPEHDAVIEPKGFYLVDSGAQFAEGTTDITRTVACGPLTEEEKLHYTLVLQGHIRLAMARFPQGVRGENLDVLARGPLWEHGLTYNHGTGHGVGHVLNVHEGPQRISWQITPGLESAPLTVGMLTSDEPGYYEAGSHGIRTENLMLCVADRETEYGPFLKFETVTLCPIDLRPVVPGILKADEVAWLNEYHERVRRVIGPQLEPDERAWLEEAARPLEA